MKQQPVQNYNIFQEIPIEISKQCQAVSEEKLPESISNNLKFQKVFWLISLNGDSQTALQHIHIANKSLQYPFQKQNLQEELELLKNTVLPTNCNISGIISYQDSELYNQADSKNVQEEFNKLIQSMLGEFDIFCQNFYSLQSNEQCVFTYPNWKQNIKGTLVQKGEIKEEVVINLAKYSDINDILRNYIVFQSEIQYEFFQEDSKIGEILQNLRKNIKAVNIENSEIYLNVDESVKILNQKEQQGGKKKSTKNQVTDSQLLQKLLEKQLDQTKSKALEFAKNCPGISNIIPINVNPLIQETQCLNNSYPQIVNVKSRNVSQIKIGHISYFKVDKQNIGDKLDLVLQHFQNFIQKIEFLQNQQNINENQNIDSQFYFFHMNQPIYLGVNKQKNVEINQIHKMFHLQQIHSFINDNYNVSKRIQLGEQKEEKLKNIERYLPNKLQEGGKVYKIFGDYVFHHYMQDGFNDSGWGCAYRSCMSVLSWFVENNYTQKNPIQIPSIHQIQRMLVEMGDKEVSFIKTSQWIGAMEVSYILQKLLDIDCKIIFLNDGSDINTKLNEFKAHFETEGTPIMFGGDKYAYTMLGIDYSEENCEARFLILDPHYVGNDQFKNSVEKNGISWKKASLFLPNTFYNFCCPQRPKQI